MRALVVAPQPFFSPRGTPLSVYYRTLITAELGVEVDLLTYGQGQDVDIPGVRITRIPRFKALGDVKVGPSLLKLYLDGFILAKMVQLLLKNKYDFVHVHEEAMFFGLVLKPIFGFRLIYDMHSSLPQQLSNFEFTESRLLISLFEKLENAGLRSADVVITIDNDLYEYANSILKDRSKHWLIENSVVDPVRLLSTNGVEKQDVRIDGQLDGLSSGKRLVVYTGTLEPYQGIDMLLQAFPKVVGEVRDAFLLIAGGTEQQVRHYSGLADELGIAARARFTGTVPKNQAATFVRMADVLLSPRIKGGMPLKIYEQLASGIPLVATNVRSHTQVLNDDVAFLVEPEPDSLARGIIQALESAEARQSKVLHAKQLYDQKYSRERYTEKMRQVLEAIR